MKPIGGDVLNPTVDQPELRRFDPAGNRRGILQLYLLLRALFAGASLLGILTLELGWLDFPGLASDAVPSLWQAWGVFFSWSIVLGITWLLATRSQKLSGADRLILVSILPDTLALFLAASVTGGMGSPLYHSVYFLIAIHSYHLAVPGAEGAAHTPFSLGMRYMLTSILPSFVAAVVLFLALEGKAPFGDLRAHFEVGLQLVTAVSFSWFGWRDRLRSQKLAERENEIEHKSTDLQMSEQALVAERLRADESEQQRVATRRQQDRMLEALGRVLNIAEVKDSTSFQHALEQLSERIGQALDAEYCAVGFVYETTIEDVATWTRSPLTGEGKTLLSGARVVPLEGSFIGSIVSRGTEALIWKASDRDPFDSNNELRKAKGLGLYEAAVEAYRKVLPGGSVRDMLLVPFTSLDPEPKPLGYLHLINRSANGKNNAADGEAAGFSEQQANRLKTIAALLATAITNYRNQRLALEEAEDAQLLDEIQLDEPQTDPFRKVLTLINQRLDSRVASLWLPVVDGFDPSPETRKMLLRTVVVSGEPRGTLDNQVLEHALRADGQILQAKSYVGRLLEEDPELKPHYQPDLTHEPHCWQAYLDEIGTPRLLVVPIPDPLAPSDRPQPLEERLLAVLCVRPIGTDFHLGTPIQDRITRYAQFIQQLLLERRLKRRFSQIEDLRLGLDTVQVDDQAAFYRGLVDLVRKVIGAEACSLFLTAREPNKLVLKATTAAEAMLEESAGTRATVNTESLLGRALYRIGDANFTSQAFERRKAVLVCDTNAMQLGRRPFLEVVPTAKHRSVLAAPLVGSTREVYGVLRCVNPQDSVRLASGFLPSDLRFFTLVASVLARFIEIAELASRRRRFMREVAHEFATPLLQAETSAAFLLRILEGRQSTRDPRTIVDSLKENVRHMQAQVRNMQFHTRSTADFEAVFNFNEPVDVHGLIDSLRKPMLGVARLSRGIEIFGATDTLPKLYVDRARMAQVFYNLLQNAVKYSPLGSKPIKIYHDRHEERIKAHYNFHWHRIRISNYGIGVTAGEEERIFEEYGRGSNTQGVRQGQSGAGLGLTIARRIVEGHGGILRLERNDNPTIFAVLLPASLEKEASSR